MNARLVTINDEYGIDITATFAGTNFHTIIPLSDK